MEIVGLVVVVGVIAFVVLSGNENRHGHTPHRRPRNIPPRRPANPVRPAVRVNPSLPANRRSIKGRAWVIDGDTIAIDRIKIRLAGIDAPELDMPWGRKAKWAMVDICRGQTIRADLTGETSYDRFVAVCYLPDGRDIGAELVKRGLALDLPHFSGGRYRHLEPDGARRRLANGAFGHRSLRR